MESNVSYAQVPLNDPGYFDQNTAVPIVGTNETSVNEQYTGQWTEEEYREEMARRLAEEQNARLGCAVLFEVLDQSNPCRVETASVYGPGIVMPQFARSSGYHRRVTELALRSLLFVAINILIQGSVLWLFSKEENVMDPFTGRMGLCDFGSNMDNCPGAKGCIGPGGTEYKPLRRYPFIQWKSRQFGKNSLTALFPEKEEEIADIIDPGEWGVESSLCRVLCCLLYMMAVTKDAFQIYELGRLLWLVPTRAESWMWYENYEALSQQPELSESRILYLSNVKLRIAGMPFCWKVFNTVFIMFPKIGFWLMTADLGIAFLMNTSDITDSIVNSMALAFILSIDELIFETATAGRTKYMMEALEPFHTGAAGSEQELPTDQVLAGDELKNNRLVCNDLFPKRLVIVIVMTICVMSSYFYTRCERTEDGTWVSKPLHYPASVHYSPLAAYLPMFFEQPAAKKLMWQMPNNHHLLKT